VTNPNLAASGVAAVAAVLIDGQLASGDNDFTVGSGKAWVFKSLTLCNTTSSAVTVAVSAKKSGGTFRKFVDNYSIAARGAADGSNSLSLNVGAFLPAMLPEGAVVRINAGTGSAVDVLGTGTELG
jgi:hypothetical protein